MRNIYLLLGSNLGDRHSYLREGALLIEREIGPIEKSSSIYQTASWGNTGLPEFLNQALQVSTSLSPRDLLFTVNAIEKSLGRERVQKWGSRTLDIDILLYENEIINEPDLVIPHPLMQERRFALAPLCEIAPDMVHPLIGKKIKELLSELSDDLYVQVESDNNNMPQDINKTTFDIDLSYLNDIADGNAEFIIDMIDIFMEQTPVYFDQLDKAIQEKDWKVTGDVAHKIKPTLAFMGVEAAKEQMAEIERKARNLDHTEEIEEKVSQLKVSCESLYAGLQKIKDDLQGKG
ncbi:2-amino-4-hydroxy-6-hydroxymethyldihydropteridine diphosphokinase [Arcticibacter tournemirensis]|uniref:2-amino-4-hydroxy-6-hydroxymethyldihydropteridine pyrophosphokinase n=1 Tax=Arcticibacter tournemirensis TaxID=699437 RepID=A0A5M9HIN1_9SPHI|nr:2-amino-4-hydroxy-6-hydroxymethyldihydropteridine diphosphokinase [Arcticibacter tournemirensis]KAA8486315.1 2-amino-4-hydroxy-6-hydroxymethyldihydropteridine diphosphokinase [Arcticibacter tournemirensis]TQM52127.1 2-amino-4-hydroxy-6-hydroxymethyldihydropteridine diphosphokinase [Arcticibacter tournemirensis]